MAGEHYLVNGPGEPCEVCGVPTGYFTRTEAGDRYAHPPRTENTSVAAVQCPPAGAR